MKAGRQFGNLKYIILNWKAHAGCALIVILICGSSTLLSLLLHSFGIGKENLLMIFLVGVLLSTVATRGYIYGLIASALSVFLFNYYFTEPVHTFLISNKQDVLLLVFFLIAALICGMLSSKVRHQTENAKRNEKTAQRMYEITESFLNLTGTEAIVENGIRYITRYAGCACKVALDTAKFDSSQTVFLSEGYTEKEGEEWQNVLPIEGRATRIGTVTLAGGDGGVSEGNKLVKTVVYQMGTVLDREFIYIEREKIKLAMESEHLKTTLLRSVSHDIRTPLTGIMGASTMICEEYASLDEESVRKLASDIKEESAWLIMTVQNILDMTRIADGKLVVKKEFESVDDLLDQAAARITLQADPARLSVRSPEKILLVEVDGNLFVQVLVNLLDNAYKHSGDNSSIELSAYQRDNKVVFEVSDNGMGIAPAVKDTLFDGFVTLPRKVADSGRGVGLGLSICKAIVSAHGGSIEADNKRTGGAVFRITMDMEEG